MTAVPSEILQELAWCRAGRLGCWCAVRGANEWCKFYDSSLLPTVSDQFCAEDSETGSLTISAPPPPSESSILLGVSPHHLAWSFPLLPYQSSLRHLYPTPATLGLVTFFLAPLFFVVSTTFMDDFMDTPHTTPSDHPLGADEYVSGPDLPHHPLSVCGTF